MRAVPAAGRVGWEMWVARVANEAVAMEGARAAALAVATAGAAALAVASAGAAEAAEQSC